MRLGELEALFALTPQIVLVGSLDKGVVARSDVRAACASRGIALEMMDLGAACRTFNILVQEERRVAAALFLDKGHWQKKAT
jgi:uncharacterized protein